MNRMSNIVLGLNNNINTKTLVYPKVKDKQTTIMINCQPLQHENRGIGRYGKEFITSIVCNSKFQYVFLCNNYLNKLEDKFDDNFFSKENVSKIVVNFDKDLLNKINSLTKKEIDILEIKMAKIINIRNPDIYLTISPFDLRGINPPANRLKKNIKTCSILHDLIPLKTKEVYRWNLHHKIKYYKTIDDLLSNNVLFSNSEFTKKDCSNIFQNIVYLGTGYNHLHFNIDENEEKEILSKYNLNNTKYIFTQSGWGENKGFIELFNSYSLLSNNIKSKITLVYGTFSLPENLETLFKLKKIKITGYLSEKEKFVLHKNAWIYIGASTYEGFGFSLVEAMNHDVPVIANNCTSLTEVVGNVNYLFNYENNGCTKLICKLFNDENFYKECKNYSSMRKNHFSWKEVVNRFKNYIKLMTN